MNGSPLPAASARTLASVTVAEELSRPSRCDLVFDEPDGALAREGIALGSALRVTVTGEATSLFRGEVTGLEIGFAPDRRRRVVVRAHDPLQRLRRRQVVRAHLSSSLESLAGEMAADIGLTLECHGTTPSWRYLINERTSDFDFLIDLAQRAGFHLIVRDDTLHVCSLEGFGEAVDLELGEALLEARFDIGNEPACGSVSVLGWDALGVRPTRGDASSPRAPARTADWFDVGETTNWTILDGAAESDDAAQLVAQAAADSRAAREMVLRGVATGRTDLRPGARLHLQGVPASVADDYVVTTVIHTVDGSTGFQSELSTAPPRAPAARTASRLTLGKVTRVDDPNRAGRVKATLLAFGDIESDWMHVLSPGAGPKKGLAALPDVADTVLVALTHEDPARGVILGGLYGESGPADDGVTGNAIRRYAVLMPGGNALRFDDEKGTVRVENGDGSFLELSPQQIHLHAKRDLVLEAPGRAVVIRGDSIDFRKG